VQHFINAFTAFTTKLFVALLGVQFKSINLNRQRSQFFVLLRMMVQDKIAGEQML